MNQPHKIELSDAEQPHNSVDTECIAKSTIDPAISTLRAIHSIEGGKIFGLQINENELLQALDQRLDEVVMSDAESMLMGQAIALQSLFVHLLEKGKAQTQMQNLEGYFKLALRAQNQSRATLETLSNIKNPPIVYAKQANITTGAQQINNHAHAQTAPLSRENKIHIEPNELLEHSQHEQRMDSGTPRKTGRVNQRMATMEKIDRSENHRGQKHLES